MYEVLAQRGLEVWLVDARQMKYVPGRKSDVQHCRSKHASHLQKLMSLGLLRAAWRHDGEVCVVRAVARRREVLITDPATWVQRMQKALLPMNIRLTDLPGDVMGMTGQAIICTIVAGERDPRMLARHRRSRVKASAVDVAKVPTGNGCGEHLLVPGRALAMYDDIARRLSECDAKLQTLLGERSRARVDLGRAPKAGSKSRVEFDVRQSLALTLTTLHSSACGCERLAGSARAFGEEPQAVQSAACAPTSAPRRTPDVG